MIKNILIILIILYICNVNGAITITSTIKSIGFGKSGTITIGGTGFLISTPVTIKLGGYPCTFAECLTTTTCECTIETDLPSATELYDITITQNSETKTAKLFKYAPPTVTDHMIEDGNMVSLRVLNTPRDSNGYKIQINDGVEITVVNVINTPPKDSESTVLRFKIPQSVAGGELNVTIIDPLGFTHDLIKETLKSTISSMTPNEFHLSGTLVTVTGTYFGKTATVIIGTSGIPVKVTNNDTACSFTFTTTTRYESPLSITIKNAAGNLITSDSAGKPFNFTYKPPVITSSNFIQEVGEIVITTSNTGTDKSQMKLTINSVETTITSFVNGIIKANIPHDIPEGETIFSLTPGPNLAVESKLLIAPIISPIELYVPVTGGQISITGMFLKHSRVLIESGNEIKCTANDNGESLLCPIGAGSGSVKLTIVNYKDSNDPNGDSANMAVDLIYGNPPPPESSKEVIEKPSSSSKLFASISFILSLISLVLFI